MWFGEDLHQGPCTVSSGMLMMSYAERVLPKDLLESSEWLANWLGPFPRTKLRAGS